MKLIASAQMLKVRLALKRKGQLGQGMSVSGPPPVLRRYTADKSKRQGPGRKHANGDFVPMGDKWSLGLAKTGELEVEHREALISGVVDYLDMVVRVCKTRIGVARQGNPLAFKDVTPQITNPNDPTPEWQRKSSYRIDKETSALEARSIGKGEVIPAKRYRTKHPLEAHGEKFRDDVRFSLERFLQDSAYAQRISVANPNRGGGYAYPGSRLGGLGNVTQRVRDGHARFEWAYARLDATLLAAANALVLREMTKADGTPFSLEEFGARILPAVLDNNRRWGISAGTLVCLGERLLDLYSQCPIRVRRVDEEELRLERAG